MFGTVRGRPHCRYTDYLLEALHRRELFQWLQLKPRAAWHGLLFRDRYNWHGIVASLDPELRASLATQPGTLTQVPPPLCLRNIPQPAQQRTPASSLHGQSGQATHTAQLQPVPSL